MTGRRRVLLWTILPVVALAVAVVAVEWARTATLPGPDDGARMLARAAEDPRRHTGVRATCREAGDDADPYLRCRMRDDAGRFGWGRVWIGTETREGYRGRRTVEGVYLAHDFPLDARGTGVLALRVPGAPPGPVPGREIGTVLSFALVDPLRAAGYETTVLTRVDCPPLPPSATVRCTVDGVPAGLEVTRPGPGPDVDVRLTVPPRP